METLGKKHIKETLIEAWTKGIHLQSDFYRANPLPVAYCASRGWITIEGADESLHNRWLITKYGLEELEEIESE